MKKLAMLLALCVGFSLAAAAQYGSSSSSSPSASQGTSSSSSSDQATTSKKSKASKGEMGAKEHTVTGCLSGPNDEGAYVLKNGHYKNGLEVGGNDELKSHVGHEVKLTGTWASESAMGEKEGKTEAKEGKSEAKEKHLKVSKIEHVSDTCKMAGKTKKEKGTSSTPPSM
jgi:hypothetical protein